MTVTAFDVETSLGRPLTETEAAQVNLWIRDAILVITANMGREIGVWTIVDLDPDILDYVVREAVVDRVKHPDAATSVSVAVDDARVERRYERASGRITILSEWWDLLRPSAASSGQSFTIVPG